MRYIVVLSLLFTLGGLSVMGQGGEAGEFVFHRVLSGPIRWELVERGEVQPLVQAELVCKLRNDEGGKQASTITWLIEDGSMIKKGELLARFDDSKVKEMLEKQKLVVDLKKSELKQAQEERTLVTRRAETEVETAKLADQLADLELQDAKEERLKARLAIKKRMAELASVQAKREMANRVKQAEARVLPLEFELQAAEKRLKEMESQLEQCQLLAPRDGMAIYLAPESTRFSANTSAIAVGEPVKEGQKVISVADLSRFQVVCKVHESVVNRVQLNLKAKVTIAGKAFPATVSAVSPMASATDWMAADVKVYTTRLTLDQDVEGSQLRPGMTAQVVIGLAEREFAVQIPAQAVREQRGLRYCYVKKGTGVERRDLKTGINNGQTMEVLAGLKVGDEVVMNPPRTIEPKETRRPVVPDPKPMGVLQLRSIRPSSGIERRSFIERYGLTQDDLAFLRSLSPALLAPVRQSLAETRNSSDDQMMTVPVLGVTPEFATFHPSLGTGIDGRFLCDHDSSELARVAVIGKAVADKLFPRCNPLGETLRMSGKYATWTIVGVLAEQQGNLERMNEAVLLPYTAELAHHGETVVYRSSGTRGAEVVPYSHILFQPAPGQNAKQTARIIRSRLEMTHAKEDWALSEPEGR